MGNSEVGGAVSLLDAKKGFQALGGVSEFLYELRSEFGGGSDSLHPGLDFDAVAIRVVAYISAFDLETSFDEGGSPFVGSEVFTVGGVAEFF